MEIALPTGDTQHVFSRLARDAEFFLVYNLDSFGPFGRDTTRGLSLFRNRRTFSSPIRRSFSF